MARYLGITRETAYGTPIWTESKHGYIDIVDESFESDNQIIIVDGVTTEARRSAPGPYKIAGGFNVPADVHLTGHYLMGALGKGQEDAAPGGDTGAYSNLFWPGDTLPSYSLRIGYDSLMERRITSAVVNSLSIEAVAGEVVTCAVDMIASDEEITTSPESEIVSRWGLYEDPLNYPDTPIFVFHHGAVKIGNSAKDVEAFRVSINNNLVDDAYKLGSRMLYKNIMQKREITITIDMEFADETEYSRFFEGGATPTVLSPADCIGEFELDLTLTSCDAIVSSDNYSLQLYFPRTQWTKTGGPNLSGRDTLMYSLESTQCLIADPTYLASVAGDPDLSGYVDYAVGVPAVPEQYAMVAILNNTLQQAAYSAIQ